MRFHWLLWGFIGGFLLCSPANAGKILSWEFTAQDNSLVFKTEEGVQPQAELLSNPTRLVIDLPGTTLGRETIKRRYSGTVRGFRIGQPESDTTRIVVEWAPGYSIDADKIEFESVTPNHWEVDIPEPRISRIASSNKRETIELPQVELESSAVKAPRVIDSPFIKSTRNGFYVAIDGNRKIKIDSVRKGDRINFVLEGITIPPELVDQEVAVNQYGVSTIAFEQQDDERAVMSLAVAPNSPDWLATFSRIKGLLLATLDVGRSPRGISNNPL
ncbi:MAG: AMIN domain-containing protein, partial [Cyanobacteria bacterium J06558_2]